MRWAGPGPRADAALRAELYGTDVRAGRPRLGDPAGVAGLGHRRRRRVPPTLVARGRRRCWSPATSTVSSRRCCAPPSRHTARRPAPSPHHPRPASRPTTIPRRHVPRPIPRRRTPWPIPRRTTRRPGGTSLLVDRPGSVQSTLRLAHRAPARDHADRVPLLLASVVLGGAFTSRLNHLLREERGYTYGVAQRPDDEARRGALRGAHRRPDRCHRGRARRHRRRGSDGCAPTASPTTRTVIARTWQAGRLPIGLQTPGGDRAAPGRARRARPARRRRHRRARDAARHRRCRGLGRRRRVHRRRRPGDRRRGRRPRRVRDTLTDAGLGDVVEAAPTQG